MEGRGSGREAALQIRQADVVGPEQTLTFQRVLQRAVFHVQSSGKREVTGANVLVAIFSEKQSHAVFLLEQHEVVEDLQVGLRLPVAACRRKFVWWTAPLAWCSKSVPLAV